MHHFFPLKSIMRESKPIIILRRCQNQRLAPGALFLGEILDEEIKSMLGRDDRQEAGANFSGLEDATLKVELRPRLVACKNQFFIILIEKKRKLFFKLKQKSQQHPKGFPGGPPPQYWPDLSPLDFRMGSGVFDEVWPLAKTIRHKPSTTPNGNL